jgi:hypothetical protein
MVNHHVYERGTLNPLADEIDESVREQKFRTSTQEDQETSMNHSIYSADRATHLKVVVVALVAGITVAGLGITARLTSDDGYAQTARVIKADRPVAVSSTNTFVVR